MKNEIKNIRVCGIVGNPNRNNNVDQLVSQVLNGAESLGANVQKHYLDSMYINPFRHSKENTHPQFCQFKDIRRKIYWDFESADAVVFGSPISLHPFKDRPDNRLKDRSDCMMPYMKVNGQSYDFGGQFRKPKKGIFVTMANTYQEFNRIQATIKDFCQWSNIKLLANIIYSQKGSKFGKVIRDKEKMDQVYLIGQRLAV